MKLSVERSDLLRALTHVHRIVERRNTIPVLANALLQCEDNQLLLRATDLDIEIQEQIPAVVENPGATTVPAQMAFDITRKLPDGSQVSLELGEDKAALAMKTGRSRFSLQVLPKEDFPDISVGTFSHTFKIKAKDLKSLAERTQFAICTEEARYYLNGFYLHVVEKDGVNFLRAVATDGHRLALAEILAPEGSSGMPGVIVPRKTVTELHRLLEDSDEEALFELSDAKLRLSIGNIVLVSKLIDGTFPDYMRVIPQNNSKTMTVDHDDFKASVDRVSAIAGERGRGVKLAMNTDTLTLTVTNPESGVAIEELPVAYEHDALEIGFNSAYLIDIVGQIESVDIVFQLEDSSSPTLIKSSGEQTELFVLMPMRV